MFPFFCSLTHTHHKGETDQATTFKFLFMKELKVLEWNDESILLLADQKHYSKYCRVITENVSRTSDCNKKKNQDNNNWAAPHSFDGLTASR